MSPPARFWRAATASMRPRPAPAEGRANRPAGPTGLFASTIVASGNGVDATSTGTGGVTVNQTGGTIGLIGNRIGGIGINAASSGTAGDINVTALNVFSVDDGVQAAIINPASAGNINVTVA